MAASRKPRGRIRAARAPTSTPETEGQHVKFTGSNGERYLVDVAQMCQQNLRSGHRRAILHKGGRWFFDGALSRKGSSAKNELNAKWAVYSNELQPVLESAFCSVTQSIASNKHEESQIDKRNNHLVSCDLGHLMKMAPHWKHSCNLCEAMGTEFRCSSGCDFDMCKQCAQQVQQQGKACPIAVFAMATPQPHDARAACDSMLAPNVKPLIVLTTLQMLVQDQGLQFSAEDARRATFYVGSIGVLQLVLCSGLQVQMLGLDIFDRRYPGLVLDAGLRACVKILLSRGARLGKFAPASKLLRKVEADVQDAWAQRYLNSMMRSGIDMPEHVQHYIMKFLV